MARSTRRSAYGRSCLPAAPARPAGRVTRNRAPPRSDSRTSILPSCRPTRWRARASPSPVPGRFAPPSSGRKRSKIAARRSGATPGPESSTESTTPSAPASTRHRTRPPAGANLNAFDSRFITTRCSFSGSTAARQSSTSRTSETPRSAASMSKREAMKRTRAPRSVSRSSALSWPASSLDSSSRSPTCFCSSREWRTIESAASRRSAGVRVSSRARSRVAGPTSARARSRRAWRSAFPRATWRSRASPSGRPRLSATGPRIRSARPGSEPELEAIGFPKSATSRGLPNAPWATLAP